MISDDKNIVLIADLVKELKEWLVMKKDITKLDIIEKVVRICTALTVAAAFTLLLLLCLIYLSFAAAYTIGGIIGSMALAFLSVGLFYVLLFLMLYAKRRAWIERPLVRFLASILLEERE